MALFIISAGGFAAETGCVLNNLYQDVAFSQDELYYLSDDKNQWDLPMVGGRVIGSMDEFDCAVDFFEREHSLNYLAHQFIVAVGSPKLKMSLVARAKEKGWQPFPFIRHRQSFIGDAEIGDGTIICSMCSITTNVTIGRFVNINLNCTIGHDAIIEDYVNLSPHCTISGKAHIKRGADLGNGVHVHPGVTVGENSVIGAGAVLIEDVPNNVVVVAKGVKGQVIKELT